MDLRLILDGGAAPPAPPGKGIESPPPPEEFEKTLQQAQKGTETPGEVAENEPNAPLQKLDSKEKETGNEIPVAVLVEQTVAIPVQFAVVPQVAALQLAVAVPAPVDAKKTDCTSTPFASTPSTPLTPATPVSTDAPAIDPTQNFVPEGTTTENEQPVELDALVASLLSGTKLTAPQGKVEMPTMPVNTGTEPTASVTVAAIAEQAMPKDLTKTLNVVSVQSVSNAVIAQQIEATVPTGTTKPPMTELSKPAEKVFRNDSKFVKGMEEGGKKFLKDYDSKFVPLTNDEPTAIATESQPTGTNLTGDDAKEESSMSKKDGGFETAVTEVAAPTTTAAKNTETVQAPTNTNQLTTAERQRVVDTITKRIEELSVNSVRNEVRVEMHPPELGSVFVNVRKDLAGLTATLNASNEPLRQALHESRNDLAGALADRNVGQVRIEVRGANADTMNMGQQFNQAQSQSQDPRQHHPRHTAANQTAQRQESGVATSSEQKAAPRRLSTSAFDMEI